MRIIDIPEYKDKRQLLKLDLDTKLEDATVQMKKMNYGAVLVTKQDKLCGIFTERDLLMKVVAEKKDVKKLKLKDVMTQNPKTANVNDPVYDAMRRMTQGRFRHLPIVDHTGHLTGLISQGDFVAITWQQLFHQFKTHIKSSFSTFTQIWILVITVLVYITFMLWMVSK